MRILHVLERDLALCFRILVDGLDIGVDGIDKGILGSLFRCAAVFQPGGVVIVFQPVDLIGEAQGGSDLHFVIVHVLPVAAFALGLPELGHGHSGAVGQFGDIVQNTLGIVEIFRLKLVGGNFVAEAEGDTGIDHGLPLHDIHEELGRNVDIRKDFQIRQPAEAGTGLFPVGRFFHQITDDLTLFEMQGIFKPVPADGHIEIPGGILGGAGTQTVEAQRIFVHTAGIVVVLAAGIQLTEYQFPVVAV